MCLQQGEERRLRGPLQTLPGILKRLSHKLSKIVQPAVSGRTSLVYLVVAGAGKRMAETPCTIPSISIQ